MPDQFTNYIHLLAENVSGERLQPELDGVVVLPPIYGPALPHWRQIYEREPALEWFEEKVGDGPYKWTNCGFRVKPLTNKDIYDA